MSWFRMTWLLFLCFGFLIPVVATPLTACDLSSANLSCAPPSENESTPNPFFGQVPLFNNHDFKLGFMGRPDFPMDFGNMRTWKSGIEKQFHLNTRPDNHFYLFHGSMPF